MIGAVFQQLHGDGFGAAELDHRLVDGEAGVGIDDLGAGLGDGQQHVEHDGLGPRRNHHLLPVGIDAAHLPAVAGHGLAEFRQPRRGAIVGVAVLQRLDAGLDDVLRRLKVGFADFQVDNLAPLRLQRPRPGQHLKGGFGSQTAHTGGNSHNSTSLKQVSVVGWRIGPAVGAVGGPGARLSHTASRICAACGRMNGLTTHGGMTPASALLSL